MEESFLPRLYRQAPLNSIWEGGGNIQCLDVLRALAREPATVDAVVAEHEAASGLDSVFDDLCERLIGNLQSVKEGGARLLVEHLALALHASVLLQAGSPAADLFVRSRLGGAHGLAFGTLPASEDFATLIERALPA